MADNFQLPSLSLELYGDILETPCSFLFPAKELGETSQAGGRALVGGVGEQGGEVRDTQTRPEDGERETSSFLELCLLPQISSAWPGSCRPCPDRHPLGPAKAKFSNQTLKHRKLC